MRMNTILIPLLCLLSLVHIPAPKPDFGPAFNGTDRKVGKVNWKFIQGKSYDYLTITDEKGNETRYQVDDVVTRYIVKGEEATLLDAFIEHSLKECSVKIKWRAHRVNGREIKIAYEVTFKELEPD